jgi:hypothetical protein
LKSRIEGSNPSGTAIFIFLKITSLTGLPALAFARAFAGQSPAGDCCFRLNPPAPPLLPLENRAMPDFSPEQLDESGAGP